MALHITWCHSACKVSAMVTMVWFVRVGWWSCLVFMIDVEIIENFSVVQVIIMSDVVDEVRRLRGLCAEQRHHHCWEGSAKILLLCSHRNRTVVYIGIQPQRCGERELVRVDNFVTFMIDLTLLHRGRLVYVKEVMTVTLFTKKEGLH